MPPPEDLYDKHEGVRRDPPTSVRNLEKGAFAKGALRKLRAKFAQNCWCFVSCMTRRVRKFVANSKSILNRFICKHPFSNAPFSKFLILDCNHPVDVSRLSRGNVSSVPRTFCPIDVELHRNQVRTSWVSRETHPQTIPETFPRHTDDEIPSCVFCLSVFLLPIICGLRVGTRGLEPSQGASGENGAS